LPDADLARPDAEASYVAPRTPLEEEVAAAWKEVLAIERPGIHDNFFEIGGHSLLATRVIMLLRNRLGLNLSLRLLFENPTVAGMAAALMQTLVEQTDGSAVLGIVAEVENVSDETARQLRREAAQGPAVEARTDAMADAGD
jgi:acyl carrier protein